MIRALLAGLLALAALGLAVGTFPGSAAAQRADAIFERANQAYLRGDYAQAIAEYELLVESGIDDPDVAYNLGTAYARLERWGHAIRWFERALRLRPGDEGAEESLAAARAALGRRQAEARGEAVVQTRPPFGEALVRPFAESTLAWLVLVLNVVFFGVLIARRLTRGETPRLALAIAIPLVGALLALSGFGLAVKRGAFREGEPAVVLAPDAALREGPDPRAQPRGRADEGEPARILDAHGQWVRVKLTGGRQGWLEQDQVGAI